MGTPTLDTIAAVGNRRWPEGNAEFDEERDNNNNIVCADGFTLSVIAGPGCYSTPRPDLGYPDPHYSSPYTHVEVMANVPEWDGEYDSGGVYARVPVDLVRALIEDHGGEA